MDIWNDNPEPTQSPFGGQFMNNLQDFGFGAATSWLSNAINWQYQQKAAALNYEYGQRAADADYDRKLDFWHRNNRYNSPEEQVRRRLAAGLSKVEGTDSGNSAGLDSAISANQAGLNGPMQFRSEIDLLQSMRTFSELRQMGRQGDKIDAEVGNILANTYLASLEAELKKAGKDKLAAEIEKIFADISKIDADKRVAYADEILKLVLFDRESRANKYFYTPSYYQNLNKELGYRLRAMDDVHQLQVSENVLKDWAAGIVETTGMDPAMINTLVGAGSNLIGDLLDVFTAGLKGKLTKLFTGKGKGTNKSTK